MALERVCPKGHRWIQGDITTGPIRGCPDCWAEEQAEQHERDIQKRIAVAIEEAINRKADGWCYGICEECACWHFTQKMPNDEQKELVSFGTCQRHAPVCGGTSERTYTAWPVTRHDNWCEDFMRRYRSVQMA